jgi:hypothetical protein
MTLQPVALGRSACGSAHLGAQPTRWQTLCFQPSLSGLTASVDQAILSSAEEGAP